MQTRERKQVSIFNIFEGYYQVRSPREARSPSAMVLVSGNVTILPAALDRAASFAPLGSAANTRMAGFMDLAPNATPDIKPPPIFFVGKNID